MRASTPQSGVNDARFYFAGAPTPGLGRVFLGASALSETAAARPEAGPCF